MDKSSDNCNSPPTSTGTRQNPCTSPSLFNGTKKGGSSMSNTCSVLACSPRSVSMKNLHTRRRVKLLLKKCKNLETRIKVKQTFKKLKIFNIKNLFYLLSPWKICKHEQKSKNLAHTDRSSTNLKKCKIKVWIFLENFPIYRK